jgi:trypsin-like peptidase
MPESSQLLRESSLRGLAPARLGQLDPVRAYDRWIGTIRAQCGVEAAALFARPAQPGVANPNDPSLAWYTTLEGTREAFSALDQAGREKAEALLKERLRALDAVLLTADAGPIVASWLYIPSLDDIFLVGGKPVLTNWSFVPASLESAVSGRETHFKNTLGAYGPQLIVPPFTEVEEAAYLARVQRRLAEIRAQEEQKGDRTRGAEEPQAFDRDAARRGRRALYAPLAASGLAALLLLFLLWPGVLIYPDSAREQAALDREADVLRAGNATLEQRLAGLQDAMNDRVCRAPGGQLEPLALPGRQGPIPPAKPDPLLPPWERIRVQPPEGSAVDLPTLAFDNTVVIVGREAASGQPRRRSGFFVGNKLIVTTGAAVTGLIPESIRVFNRTLGSQPARLRPHPAPTSRDRAEVDFALLEISAPSRRGFIKVGGSPHRGQDVVAVVYPLSPASLETLMGGSASGTPALQLQRGTILSKIDSDSVPFIVHSAPVSADDDGSALVDLCGRVVGVNEVAGRAFGGVTPSRYARDASSLRRFLEASQVGAQTDDGQCTPQVAAVAPPPPNR